MTDPVVTPASRLVTRARHALSSIRVRVVVGYVGLLLIGLVIVFLSRASSSSPGSTGRSSAI